MACVPVPRSGVGDLVLVYKRITALAAHTSRVSELLEQVEAAGLSKRVAEPSSCFPLL